MAEAELTEVPRIGGWQEAEVTGIHSETARVKSLTLALPVITPFLAGQHFLVRLTAPDGYRAQRSYSVGSAPSDGTSIELTVEKLPGGEVSEFLHDELQVGDMLEVRGPIGGWFVWDGTSPALLIGGGSVVVPLMSMLRLARREGSSRAHLIVSARTPEDLIYSGELESADTTLVFTRAVRSGFPRPAGRLTVSDIEPHLSAGAGATVYVCGSTPFTDAAEDLARQAGASVESIRVERFGPSG
ncbi:MAG: FAD-binding oxidoreductase [Acidimicrobiales bacterium]